MKIHFLITLASYAFIFNTCLNAQTETKSSFDIELIASTPADSFIKSAFNINQSTVVDFIRWDLKLKTGDNTFDLNINYGESQPNTSGFKKGGEKQVISGIFSVSKSEKGELLGDVFELKSAKNQTFISFVKINDNLFHLLTPNQKLMVGNGGWSYTLNRKDPLLNAPSTLPNVTPSVFLVKSSLNSEVFDGRTPCRDFANQYHLKVPNDCIKLKWRLTFNKDSVTHLPTTYNLRRVDHYPTELIGKWTIIKGFGNNPDAVVYQLDPDKPADSVSFLVGDENVLFFLDKKQRLFVGNSNFSFTLNKKLN